MATNRYTRTSPVEFNLPIFTPNFELVAQAMGSQQSTYDKGIEDMNRQIQSLEKDYGVRDQIIEARQQKIDEIARVYQEKGIGEGNKMLKQARREVFKDHMTGGKAYAIENNYSSFNAYRDEIQKYKDAGNYRKAALLQRSLDNYQGIGEGQNGIYNSFSGVPIAKEVDAFAKADEYGKGWKADRAITGRRREDGFFITESMEFIDPGQLKRDVFKALSSDSEIMEDLSQEAMLMGKSGAEAEAYINQKLNEAADFSADKNANQKVFEDSKVDWQARDRARRNHEWSMKLYEEEKPYLNPSLNGIEMVDGQHTMTSLPELEKQYGQIQGVIQNARDDFSKGFGVDVNALESRLEGLSGVELNNALRDYGIPIDAYKKMNSFVKHKEQELIIAEGRRKAAQNFANEQLGERVNDLTEFDNKLESLLVSNPVILESGETLTKEDLTAIMSGSHHKYTRFGTSIVRIEDADRYQRANSGMAYSSVLPQSVAIIPEEANDYYNQMSQDRKDLIAERSDYENSYLENDSRGRPVSIDVKRNIPISKDNEPNQKLSEEFTNSINDMFITNHADYLMRSGGQMFSGGKEVSPEQILEFMTNDNGELKINENTTSIKYTQGPLGSTGRRMMTVTYSSPNGGLPLIVSRPVPTEIEDQIIHKGQRAKEYDEYGRPNVNGMRINAANEGIAEAERRIAQFLNYSQDDQNFEMPTADNPNVKMYNYNPRTEEQTEFNKVFFTTGELDKNGELVIKSADGRKGVLELANALYPDIINTQDNGEANE